MVKVSQRFHQHHHIFDLVDGFTPWKRSGHCRPSSHITWKTDISETVEPTGTTWINLSIKPSPWTIAIDRGSPKKFVTRGRSQGAP